MIGRTLAHYTVTGKIGEGGMGEVYRATDTRLKREVALKVLPGTVAEDSDYLARFQREAESVAALNHPNIVTIYSVDEVEGIHLLTMELVDGESLDRSLPTEGLSLAELFRIAIPLADALQAAHEAGIVHRDLKPANVMITKQGGSRCWTSVWPRARPVRPSDADPTQAMTAAPLTEVGMVLGTGSLHGAEQLMGKPVDGRTDLFALGVVLYELSTGTRPFTGGSFAEISASILMVDPPPLTERRADLPAEFGRIVRRCLAKEPERRYQTARDVKNDLEVCSENSSGAGGRVMRDTRRSWLRHRDSLRLGRRTRRLPREPHPGVEPPALQAGPRVRGADAAGGPGEETASGRWSAQPKTYRDLGELLKQVNDPALVVLGSPGCGKSTLLRRLELEAAQKGLTDPEQPVTLFIQLNQYKGEGRGEAAPAPIKWLAERWSARHSDLPPLSELLKNGRMILLLDALNEMPTASTAALHEAVLGWKNFLDRLVSDHPGTRVVFSCRTLDYSASLSTPALRVPQVVVEPLTDEQVAQFLEKQSPEQGARIWSELKGTPQLELLRSPYFLSLLTHRVEATGEVPQGRAELFTGFVRQALRREVESGNPLFAPERPPDRARHPAHHAVVVEDELGPARARCSGASSSRRWRSRCSRRAAAVARCGWSTTRRWNYSTTTRTRASSRRGSRCRCWTRTPGRTRCLYAHQLVQEYFAGRSSRRRRTRSESGRRGEAQDLTPPLATIVESTATGRAPATARDDRLGGDRDPGCGDDGSPDAYVRDLMATTWWWRAGRRVRWRSARGSPRRCSTICARRWCAGAPTARPISDRGSTRGWRSDYSATRDSRRARACTADTWCRRRLRSRRGAIPWARTRCSSMWATGSRRTCPATGRGGEIRHRPLSGDQRGVAVLHGGRRLRGGRWWDTAGAKAVVGR